MHVIAERYYKINRIFLKAIGLWPYQQSYLVEIQKVLCTGILLSFIIVQLLVLVFTTQYNLALVLNVLSLVFPVLFVTIKYCLFAIQKDSVKELLEQIQDHWKLMVTELEIEIIEKYARNTRSLTLFAMAFCHCAMFPFAILHFLPLMLDVILPLNESRPLQFIVTMEYLINQEEYFYIIFLHVGLTFVVSMIAIGITTATIMLYILHAFLHVGLTGVVAMIAICITTATIMLYILHACALFKVASHRIENAIDQNITYPNAVKQYLFYRRILHAVIIHRKAIEFIKTFTSNFAIPYDILIIVGVTSLSINLFQFSQLVALTNNVDEAFMVAILIFLHLIYMFLLNYGGQEVMDHGKKLFNAIYNGLWYTAPLHTQKLLLFMMQKSKVDVILTMGTIFVATLEGLASLISMTLSYFTVIYSTR
ncbi:hypothetical protein X777_14148 [Ooceraea biroi]|uniref:Odorant receptor n=1 Tax=Ooceraea biroi TaxID=2015173 RepID=A0A026VWT0_OOCBI|nr:hypothetical protein X777_14148 [Ooceraea biroi]